jgi:hypothetical protein
MRKYSDKYPASSMPFFLQPRNTPALLLVCCIVAGGGCAGYNLGDQFLYRSDIRTVHVAMFESDSYRKFLGQQLTEAVAKQIELSTPLTITDSALADSFLQGRIISDQKRVVAEDRSDEPRELLIDYRLEVSWVDRAGVPLMQRQLVKLDLDAAFVPEGGQSMGTAQVELINRIAREIVGQMEAPW